MEIIIEVLPKEYSVCKLATIKEIPLLEQNMFVSVTQEEISLVCVAKQVPATALETETGWRLLKIAGQLDFSLVGILARISSILAEQEISIFVISTFNTDYILIKKEKIDLTLQVLEKNNYKIKE